MAYSLTYSFNFTSQSYLVTGYSDITTSDNVVIPSTYDDGTNGEHPVTSIGSSAFYGCSGLTSITIPDGVTSIEGWAFQNCSGLTSVTIGNSVTSIGDYAFAYCSSLTSVTIPNSVTSIGYGAFYNCSSLASVTIGNSVTSIGDYAFAYCRSLTSISVDDNNQSYKSIDGNLYTKDGTTLIQYTIGKTATSFVIPDSVTSLVPRAFADCSSLTSITIPNIVTSIAQYVFSNCSSLIQLILFPSAPPTLGSNTIPDNVQSIYVQQSSKAAYQAATNWTTFASKIVGDNMYLSFVRFNQKNKEYIDRKVDELKRYIDNKIAGSNI